MIKAKVEFIILTIFTVKYLIIHLCINNYISLQKRQIKLP